MGTTEQRSRDKGSSNCNGDMNKEEARGRRKYPHVRLRSSAAFLPVPLHRCACLLAYQPPFLVCLCTCFAERALKPINHLEFYKILLPQSIGNLPCTCACTTEGKDQVYFLLLWIKLLTLKKSLESWNVQRGWNCEAQLSLILLNQNFILGKT